MIPFRIIIVYVLLAGLIGCQSGKMAMERQYYVLDCEPVQQEMALDASKPDLMVRPIAIASVYERDNFLIRRDVAAYSADYYHMFLTDPQDQITDLTRRWLAASGIFSSVSRPSQNPVSAYELNGTIEKLEIDLQNKEQPRCVFAIRFFLTTTQGQVRQVVFNRYYSSEKIPESIHANPIVNGWNECIKEILGRLENDLGEVVRLYSVDNESH